jgi:RNA polymerase sigma-70 factor (ECF subfamily)
VAQRDRFDGQFDSVISRARIGEPRALEEIFQALSPVVVGYLRLQGCREPEDLTSEVFVGVLRNLDSFDGDEQAFRSWVFTIAQRRLSDERRRRIRRPTPEPLSEVHDPVAAEDVEAMVAQRLETDQIRSLCAHLPHDQRDVVLLRLLGRLTVDDIARTLGKTQGGVKALQRRGFHTLGRMIDSEAGAR